MCYLQSPVHGLTPSHERPSLAFVSEVRLVAVAWLFDAHPKAIKRLRVTLVGVSMASQLVFGYMLYVNGQPTAYISRTLEGAQEASKQFINNKQPLRIVTTSTSSNAPSPIRTWNYDYAIQKWVEFVRG